MEREQIIDIVALKRVLHQLDHKNMVRGSIDAAFPLAKPEPCGLPSSPPDRFRFVYEQALADGANEVQAIGVAVEAVQPSEDEPFPNYGHGPASPSLGVASGAMAPVRGGPGGSGSPPVLATPATGDPSPASQQNDTPGERDRVRVSIDTARQVWDYIVHNDACNREWFVDWLRSFGVEVEDSK